MTTPTNTQFWLRYPKLDEPWVLTHTGLQFTFMNPHPGIIDIRDIAQGLSRQARWAGQTRTVYGVSVAEHSVLMARAAPRLLKLAVLLHDASEAYINDIPSGVKRECPDYRYIESRIMDAVWSRFEIEREQFDDPLIKTLDRRIQINEMAHTMDHPVWLSAFEGYEPLPNCVPQGWAPERARTEFLAEFINVMNVGRSLATKRRLSAFYVNSNQKAA